MEDGQDHREGGEIGAGPAGAPPAAPPNEPTEVAGAESFSAPDDADDSGLTEVLAALEEPDSDETIVADASQDLAAPVVEPVTEPAAEPAAGESAGVPTPAAEAMAMPDFPSQSGGVPIWPFLVYFALWVVFAGLLVWFFLQTPAGVPLYELTLYGPSILAGLVLTALGPLLAIGVWIMLWMARPGARAGLFSRSFILGAVVTLAGVALWLVALGAVDMLRLGRLI